MVSAPLIGAQQTLAAAPLGPALVLLADKDYPPSGFAAGTPRGVHLTHLVVPEHQQTAMSALRHVLDGDSGPRFEVDILSRLGRRLTLELDVHPIRLDAAIVGAQGIARDVTVRRELEAQLLQAQKVEAIGRLAGGVAHDFNNILTVVMGFAELATQQLDPQSPVRQDIEEIRRAAGSAASLTRQLLIFSRKSVVRPRVFDLNEVVGQLNKMLRRLVGAHLNFVVRPGDDVGHVKADPSQIEQVIVNLVVNARDAMPAGGTLTIRTGNAVVDAHFAAEHRLQGTGEFVTLVVADTGMGMTPEVQARIFQPFFTTKGPTTGTGLGLATVHWIVELAGGGIVVQSRPGVGTTFTVYLPKVVGASDAEPARDAAAATVPRPRTVLFVDADESIRMMGGRALSERGFTVLTVRQPEEALALARRDSRTIDLLVTDLAMPGLNGRELADHLRRARPNLRILFTSAYMDAAAFRDVQIEHARILQKPYTPESLAREVRQLLSRE